MRVNELTPGDIVNGYVFVGMIAPHPIFPGLALVIWHDSRERKWSHDALDARQEVDQPEQMNSFTRTAALRRALLGGPGW